MPHQAPLQPGDPRRVGRYRLAGLITGIPADGPIFLGTGPDGTEVTISMLRSDWARDPAARDRFAAEAAVAKRVPPFCAARILDAGLDDGDAYLVSEYVPGRSLLELVTARGVLAEKELGRVAIGMATGLASVHLAGLVHGNFGPEYVIMTAAGPRVVEFGITPPYGSATPSADMLAWGQTVMYAAAGRPATAIADLDVLPEYLRDVVLECLNPDPSGRPAARAAVLALIGQDDVPAGVLAEGSLRSAPGSDFTPPPARPRAQPARQGASGPAPAGGPGPAGGHPPGGPGSPGRAGHGHAGRGRLSPVSRAPGQSAPGSNGSRPVSRHARAGADLALPAPRARHPLPDEPVGGAGPRPAGLRYGAIAAGAVLVIALLVVGGMKLLGGHGHARQAIPEKSTRRVSLQTPVPTTPARPTPTVTTPSNFAGDWAGEVRQPPNDTYHVALSLHHGSSSGSVSYQTAGVKPLSCTLNLTAASAAQLTFSETEEGDCTSGTVTLKLTGDTSAAYTFKGGGFVATGSLTRS
jgi:hypothetical protein